MATPTEMAAMLAQKTAATQATAASGTAFGGAGIGAAISNRLGGLKMPTGGIAGNLWWILPLLAGWYATKQLGQVQERQGMKQQAEHLGRLEEAVTPESAFYKAMMPEVARSNQMAEAMLLSQLFGGNMPPQLAEGEELVGGR